MKYSADNVRAYEWMNGLWRWWLPLFFIWAISSTAVWAGHHFWDIGRGDADPPHGVSGVKLITDYGTGCQYLMSPEGSLTPRLNATGKQVCKRAG